MHAPDVAGGNRGIKSAVAPHFIFTGTKGEYVSIAETVRGFKEILDGKHDEVPEQNFYMKGGIDMIKEG